MNTGQSRTPNSFGGQTKVSYKVTTGTFLLFLCLNVCFSSQQPLLNTAWLVIVLICIFSPCSMIKCIPPLLRNSAMCSNSKLSTLVLLIVLSFTLQYSNANGATIRLEAEDMSLSGFRVEPLASASGGYLINLRGTPESGTATASFSGVTGNYDILVGYHDENDGVARLSVAIAGTLLDAWNLENSPGSAQPRAVNFLIRQVAVDYTITNGDVIELSGMQGKWDHANIDYIEFVPQDSGGPPSQANPPIVLDFSTGDPMTIDEPGYYVLDRDWSLDRSTSDEPILTILADRATVDLRGFAIEFADDGDSISIIGNGVTLRNGSLSSDIGIGVIVKIVGADVEINGVGVHARSNLANAITLEGSGGKILNSIIESREDGSTVRVLGSRSTIHSNQIGASSLAVSIEGDLSVQNQVTNNVIRCGFDPCITVAGSGHVIARNSVTSVDTGPIVTVRGNDNLILDNMVPPVNSSSTAFIIDGTRNFIRGNTVQRGTLAPDDSWREGIEFIQDGNFYGDNLISAQTPFEFRGTVQVDLGGNVGL